MTQPMKLGMDGWTDKDSRNPQFRELYERHGFIEAYAKHTDLRVERVGAAGAIGRANEWESHGAEQLEFLIAQGLKPTSTLLDLGCGAGRLARRVVPYLRQNNYIGVDISASVLEHAKKLSIEEGWDIRRPTFMLGDGTLECVRSLGVAGAGVRHDFIWAHSVVTHLPPDLVAGLFAELAAIDFGAFFFTYKPASAPRRSGLKQFQYPPSWFGQAAARVGLLAETHPKVWPASQRTMRVWSP